MLKLKVKKKDLQNVLQILNNNKERIIEISGHNSLNGELYFQNTPKIIFIIYNGNMDRTELVEYLKTILNYEIVYK